MFGFSERHRFEPDTGGTRVSMSAAVEPRGVFRGPHTDHRRLKALLEGFVVGPSTRGWPLQNPARASMVFANVLVTTHIMRRHTAVNNRSAANRTCVDRPGRSTEPEHT